MGLFKKNKAIEIFAPVDGELIGLEKVEDEVFADKMLGDGFAIDPENGEFVAPFDGKLVTVFPTGHAYGIRHNSGIEVLIHIGLDTVSLNGTGFDVKVKQDDNVKLGDPLVNVDFKKIKSKVPSIKTPFIFTTDSMVKKSVEIVKTGKIKKGELIAIVS